MSFALYRLPYGHEVTLIEQTGGSLQILTSVSQLNGMEGFVIAPFDVTSGNAGREGVGRDDACPIVVIRPDVVRTVETKDLTDYTDLMNLSGSLVLDIHEGGSEESGVGREAYSRDFRLFHSKLIEGEFEKIVLTRCKTVERNRTEGGKEGHTADELFRIFREACERYPRLFVSLVSTSETGTWLAATPEVLLENEGGDRWHTIALAGTMNYDEMTDGRLWTDKEKAEQRCVAEYIGQFLRRFSDDVHEEGPVTARAAHLVHLRSDFRFTLLNNARVGDVLQELHPTPAVCGLPKEDTIRFILEHEHTPRQYYSGFMGPLGIGGTHLFVSLRCMNVTTGHYRLYAGGGLLKESDEEQEWQETEAKIDTLARLLL